MRCEAMYYPDAGLCTSKQNIGQHIKNILDERELDPGSVVKDYFTTAADGKNYEVTFYSLAMILAIGFRVKSKRGTPFRIWANQNLREYMVKGFRGKIDKASIWGRALTPAEITALYNNGNGL